MASSEQGKNKKRQGRWKKGESGNPGGRPKRDNAITEFLSDKVGESDVTRRKALLMSLIRIASDQKHRDQLRAIELLLAYDQGRPTEKVEMSGPDGGPIEHAGDLDSMTTGELRRELAELEAARAARLTKDSTDGGSGPSNG